jgi:hypothetical protein
MAMNITLHPRPNLRLAFATASLLPILDPSAAWSQGLPPIEHELANGSTLRLYGQVNMGVLSYDDGIDQKTYGPIDNDNSTTRVGLRYNQSFGAWRFENVNEVRYAPFSTDNISVAHRSPNWDFDKHNIRKIDFTLAHGRFGKFWAGQGSMATDGIYEMDLSGTTVISNSNVAESASAQIIRLSDRSLPFTESLSGITIGDTFNNYDGPRRMRFRYDTPAFNGFVAAVAVRRNLLSDDAGVRDENIFDASLTYGGSFDTVELTAGAGYYWEESGTSNWGGSVSALHTPSGINGAISIGGQDADGGTGSYLYGKLGLVRELVDWGATAAAIDYYHGEDILLDRDAGITGSTSKSLGVSLVQNIDSANTELWLTWRGYDYADNADSYEDSQAIFGGARFRF